MFQKKNFDSAHFIIEKWNAICPTSFRFAILCDVTSLEATRRDEDDDAVDNQSTVWIQSTSIRVLWAAAAAAVRVAFN